MSKETEERDARRISYYQKLVYNALLPFKAAVWAANKEKVNVGICGELDMETLLRDIKRIAGITTPDATVILEKIKAKERAELGEIEPQNEDKMPAEIDY